MLYTAEQIAETMQRSATTVRHWGRLYNDHLPGKKVKRYKQYTEQSIDIFKKIAELSDNGLFKEQIKDRLQELFGTIQDGEISEENNQGKEIVIAKDFQPVLNFFMQMNEKQESRHNETLALMQQQIKQTQQLIEILIKDKQQEDEQPPRLQVVKKPKAKKVAVKKQTSSKKKLPPRGRGGKFKKKSFWNNIFGN